MIFKMTKNTVHILGASECEDLNWKSRDKIWSKMDEPNLPRFGGAFQRAEVARDHNGNEISCPSSQNISCIE
jgi:hypothetical protein